MNRLAPLAIVLLLGCPDLVADEPSSVCGAQPVVAFARADLDGDHYLSPEYDYDAGDTPLNERDDSGERDITNALGMACPFGWSYLGAARVNGELSPLCERIAPAGCR